MLGWMGEDISPNRDGSIERFIVESSEKKRTPNEGAFVKGIFCVIFVHCFIFYIMRFRMLNYFFCGFFMKNVLSNRIF